MEVAITPSPWGRTVRMAVAISPSFKKEYRRMQLAITPSFKEEKQECRWPSPVPLRKNSKTGAASIFLILLQGMGRWPPPFLVEEKEVDLRRESKSNGHMHSYYSSLRGWRDGHIHSSYSSLMGGEMATYILTILL